MRVTKEGVLVALAVCVALAEVVNAEVLGRTFHYEFLGFALGLAGLAITGRWGDRS